MLYVQIVVAAALAAVLLSAALNKAAARAKFAGVLGDLGMPARIAAWAAVFVIGAELVVAAALIVRPTSLLTLSGVGALAIAFATAGAVAARTGKTIECGCFGASRASVLGSRQIAMLPVAGAWIVLLSVDTGSAHSPISPVTIFAAVGLLLAATRAVPVVRMFHAARGDRKSALEMYAWLRH